MIDTFSRAIPAASTAWLGYLDAYPDYMTQGTSVDDLKEHLLDLYRDLSSGAIPAVRQHAGLAVARNAAS